MKRRQSAEHQLQVAVAQFLDLALRPPVIWTSIDAGAGKMSKASAGLRKARGVKAGWPDILIMAPSQHPMMLFTSVIGVELKVGKGKLSEAQTAISEQFYGITAAYCICRSVDDVEALLRRARIPLHATVASMKSGNRCSATSRASHTEGVVARSESSHPSPVVTGKSG